ncbi:glycosyltransferase [Pediococcus acidilactici]|uniref:glycosyltransferase n=1 Tax=Pediococcus acidilactici TaxID=1254 RepID=UPI0013230165|nr:glycosyltransferase [Pediococcus acidilactici]KAF0369891.1 glycosyltransferase [Pediococcus acidilactici]KAF0388533.1 glycosyltransferase [Pediococcus acidilactici]
MSKSVLVVVRGLGNNGISNFVINTYTKLKQSGDFDIDILTLTKNNPSEMVESLKKSGISVLTVDTFRKRPLQHMVTINKILKRDYSVVHFHIDNWVNFYPIYKASLITNLKVIVQSHNSRSVKIESSKLKLMVHNIVKKLSSKWHIKRCAVSEEAAVWLFGPKNDAKVINNPVDVKRFSFSPKKRSAIREKYGIQQDDDLYGNIARLDYQKNPIFLLKVFNEIKKKNKHAKLMLVGNGILENEVKKFIYENGLENFVNIVNWTDEVADYYSAIDEIIFPSFYEGMPLSLVEAQCSGTSVLYSDVITDRIRVNKNVESCSLNKDVSYWASKAISLEKKNKGIGREDCFIPFLNTSFDYNFYIEKLIDFYFA